MNGTDGGGSPLDGLATTGPSLWITFVPLIATVITAAIAVWIGCLLVRRWASAAPAAPAVARCEPAPPASQPPVSSGMPTLMAYAILCGAFILLSAILTACGESGLDWFAIRVQRWFGILQIPTAPLMHISFAHLAADIPLLGTGFLAAAHLRRLQPLLIAGAVATVLIGLMHWTGLDTTQDVACGSSGLGYMVFAMAVVVTIRRPTWWAIGLLAAFLLYDGNYASIPGCMMPLRIVLEQHVGWMAHLVGFVVGVIAGLTAPLLGRPDRREITAAA